MTSLKGGGYKDGMGHENFISDKISFKDRGKFMSFLETKTFDKSFNSS